MPTKILKLLFIFLISTLVFSCSSSDKQPDTPEAIFQLAKEFEESDRYQIAIQRYMEVKNKFPYSSLATDAELAVADVYFKTEDFAEAQISYQNFREFHPKHPKIDYVTFRIGLSYYRQLPDTIDRDLSLANDAIYSFNEVIKKFPNSTYRAEAEDYRKKAFVMLNEKELYIADFYFKQKIYDSAFNRYEMSYKKFSGFGLDSRSVAGAIRSARALNDNEKEKRYQDIMDAKFADSKEAQDLKRGGKTE